VTDTFQLQRTVQDLGRLVPFSVFVIVPFAELLLPVALKLFPNLLPSTFEGQKSREDKAARLRDTRKGVSSFLRNTLRETGLPVSVRSDSRSRFCDMLTAKGLFCQKRRIPGILSESSSHGRVAYQRGRDQGLQDLQG
jgi:hypothetical protein